MSEKLRPITIAVAGKGGTGKTTICGMLADYLAAAGKGPLLVVDADPNANLNEVLGIELPLSLGEIRENIARADMIDPSPIPLGMSKQAYAEFMFESALYESADYDMLVMGRTQGKGCYCYVNGVLKTQLEKYESSYRYIIVDNEAGLEHISRGTLPSVDIMLLVSDSSRRGVQAAGRLKQMVDELQLKPDTIKLIVNRAPGGKLDQGVSDEIAAQGLALLGVLPQDNTVYEYDCEGRPSAKVPHDSPIKQALGALIGALGL